MALVCIDGVLARPDGANFAAHTPNREGILLLDALRHTFRVGLTTTEENREHVEYWLRLQGIKDKFYEVLRIGETPVETIIGLRRDRTDIRLFLSDDADACKQAFEMGITTSLVKAPQYLRQEFRNGQPDLRVWEDLVQLSEKERTKWDGDARRFSEGDLYSD